MLENQQNNKSASTNTSVEEGLKNAFGETVEVGSERIVEAFKEPWTVREKVLAVLTGLCALGVIARFFILK